MTECYLYKLPNELLLHILTPLPTPQLLPLTVLSHRIYTLILRILHNRLVAASELNSHSLLLECYHPSAKLTEPPYFCTYHGTDGLTTYKPPYENDANLAGRLGEMRNMYSRFRPHRRDLELGGRRVRWPPGDVPGSRTFPGTASDRFEGETVKQILSLEGHELFTQLVAQTNLVKIGPRNGLFTCFVAVDEGVVRVWREWLGDMAAKRESGVPGAEDVVEEGEKGKGAIRDIPDAGKSAIDERILWITAANNTGLRFSIKERRLRRDAPILIRADEDIPVSYEIEYNELLVRTSHLLLMLEKSLVQEDNSSGKAVVFGSFG
ncbi:F-box domain-containing protein [Lindgomyces ingoldianus]|uniref:F-box domain-containing protein n=1 Tax=Lindgomyces ingoldianus TaxID=673940 RepID=A0ACB6RBY5_9PLEO|nr:F-box domain-containing protein [Lindgomyces ingoldianus]KAF2475837.1 F-box domain-containing protein [Lindgomyces ingoldianus]